MLQQMSYNFYQKSMISPDDKTFKQYNEIMGEIFVMDNIGKKICFICKQIKLQAMQNKINKTKQKQQAWSQIIKLVERANLEESEQIKRQNLNRKKAYRKELNVQMFEQEERNLYQQNQKIKQRAQIQEQVTEEKLYLKECKIKRIKTQQKYQEQNAQLTYQGRRKHQDQIKYGQNPFVSLVDKQDMRARQTRFNFQLQNKLNAIQIQLQKQKKIEKNQSDKKIGSEYKSYIQNQHKKHQNERQSFKKKYLVIKKWEKFNQSSNSNEKQEEKQSQMQKKYINFLDHQVSQLKYRKEKQQRFLDRQLSQINKSVQLPDSSPAFLGRLPYSNDRKKQLQILDNNLSQYSSKIRPTSQFQHSMKVSPREGFKSAFDGQKQQRRAQSNIKLLPTLAVSREKEKQKNIDESLQNSQKVQLKRSLNQKRIQQTISKDNITLSQKQRKKYTKYDFIVGRHKTIII